MDILLQEGGADPDSQDCNGRTAVYVAARRIGGGDPTATETFEKMIVAARDLREGTIIQYEDLAFKKPMNGIPASKWSKLIGTRVKSQIKKDSPITGER